VRGEAEQSFRPGDRVHEREAWERHLGGEIWDVEPYTRGMVTLKLYSDFV
jgi:hypothetical protein